MIQLKLPALVKAVRFRYGLLFVLLALVVYWTAITPWMTNWGSTEAEQQMALPGDELQAAAGESSTLAVTIDAPPDVVWQWLVQVGQDRAGFYTYTWLENLFGADIHNTDEIRPEWQHLDAGAGWRLVPADYLWGLGEEALSPLLFVEPGRALVLEMWGAWVILPAGDNGSRLLVRGSSDQGNLLNRLLVAPIVFTMERRMLLGLQARAEGRPDAPAALMAVAQLGWIAAAVAVSASFWSGSDGAPGCCCPCWRPCPRSS